METELLLDKSKVKGQIYLMTNVQTQQQYVGQTLTHRKNHEKYRPFGYQGRFQDHISEALCNTKKKQCRYLNNAIRKYGKEAFQVSLLTTCEPSQLDSLEEHYIKEYNTLYPNGYNLTRGGKTLYAVSTGSEVSTLETSTPGKRGGCSQRSEQTRKKISEQLHKVLGTEENRKRQMLLTKQQHKSQKLERFKNQTIDLTHLENYLYTKHANGKPFVVVKVNRITTSFVGKFQSFEELQQQAREFLEEVAKYNCDASKLTGNP